MSQHDYNIANGGGAAVRADINNALLAVLSQNSGATAPTTTKPFMFWYDTTTGVLKMRNAADTAWVDAITGVSGGNGLGMVNRVINGRMEIDQRNNGASVTTSVLQAPTYTLDRWAYYGDVVSKRTIQQSSVAPAGFSKSICVTVIATDTVGPQQWFRQLIEGGNLTDLNWGTANAQPATLSFWVRSSVTGQMGGAIQNSATNRSLPFAYTINAADTWEFKTINIAGDTSGTWLTTNGIGASILFEHGVGYQKTTAGSWVGSNSTSSTGSVNLCATNGATWYITGVDFRKGTFTSAPAWDWRPYGTELALCQRYLPAFSGVGSVGAAQCTATNGALVHFSFPVTARVAPTGITISSASDFTLRQSTGAATTPTSISWDSTSASGAQMFASGASGLTQGNASMMQGASTNAKILFTGCEL